jgi:hypothetical protein
MAITNNDYNNSFSTSTNITFGAKELPDVFFNAQSFSLPALSFSPPNVGGRAGAVVKLPSDTVTYDELSISVILDKDWNVYTELYTYFVKHLNVEETTFSDGKFDIWLEIRDGKGIVKRKFWFYDARVMTIDGIDFDSTDDTDTPIVINITFTFNYMDFDNTFRKLKYS